MTRFSICIPNFNYATYLRITLESVLQQSYDKFEVCVSDNASTDASLEVAKSFCSDPRVKVQSNKTNLGFAGNLDAVTNMASNEYAILLSSDDTMNPNALATYSKFIDAVKEGSFAFSSSCDRIDGHGNIIGYDGIRSKVWKADDIDDTLSEKMGVRIYKVKAAEMLKRCLSSYYGYFNFASACYKLEDCKKVGSYGGGRLMNPDKWFHWKLLTLVDHVYFIDAPCFSYRWHSANQTALEKSSGAIKFFLDEYRNTFEASASMLQTAGYTTDRLEQSFIQNIIHKYVFRYLKDGNLKLASRVYAFGWATYPHVMRKTKMTYLLRSALALGPVSTFVIKKMKRNF
jgi:glycosyltransferase involved in cell wall biosynthesis